MTFQDIFKSDFLENVASVSVLDMALTLVLGFGIGLFIFLVYKKTYQGVMYSASFGVTLVALTMITGMVILAVTSNVVLSLGMVGALSIVRFRTAIKNPMDLVFLFWAIAVGIICGAGLPGIALLITAAISVGIFVLELLPVAKAPLLLIVNASGASARSAILEQVKANSTLFHVKSQTMEADRLDLIVEVRPRNDEALITAVTAIPQVQRCSLISHDGEVTF